MFDLWGSENSTLREKVVEHLFMAELSKEMLLGRHMPFEVLRSEFDGFGYDIVVEADGAIRHIQFKHSRSDAKVATQKVNLALAGKPGGCVIWTMVDRDTMDLGPFLWLGGGRNTALSDLGDRIGKHSKADTKGRKGERPAIRVVNKGAFDRIGAMGGIATMLFGRDVDMGGNAFCAPEYWLNLAPVERLRAERTRVDGSDAKRPMMWIERKADVVIGHFLFADGAWRNSQEDRSRVQFPMDRNGYYELGGRYLGRRTPLALAAAIAQRGFATPIRSAKE